MNKNIIFLIIGIILLAGVVYYIGIEEVIVVLKQADPKLLFAAFLLNLAQLLVWNFKFKSLVGKIKKVSYLPLFPVLLAGEFVTNTTPGVRTGGGPVKAYFLSKMTSRYKSECYASVTVDNVTNTIAITSFTIFSILFVFLFLNIPEHMKLIFEAVVLILAAVVLSGFFIRKEIEKKMNKYYIMRFLPGIYHFHLFEIIRKKFHKYSVFEDYVIRKLGNFADSLEKLARDRKLLHKDLVLAFFMCFLIYFKTYLLFLSIGFNPGFVIVVIVVTLSVLLSSLMIVPGGIGSTEISMIALYTVSGIDVNIATMVSLADRFIFYFFALGMGYLCLMYLNIRYDGGNNK